MHKKQKVRSEGNEKKCLDIYLVLTASGIPRKDDPVQRRLSWIAKTDTPKRLNV